jgi:hypothetical protein
MTKEQLAADLAQVQKLILAFARGDAVEVAQLGHYVSTYCIHDNHTDCRLTCKTCKAPCRCWCHRPA